MSWWGHWFGKAGSSTPIYLDGNFGGSVTGMGAVDGSVINAAISGVAQLSQEIRAALSINDADGTVQNGISLQGSQGAVFAVGGQVANVRQVGGAVTMPEINGQI